MQYEVKINNKKILGVENFITGNELLNLAGYNPAEDFDLYMKLEGNEYEPIQSNEKVDLSKPGIETFIVEPRKEIKFSIDDDEYSTKKLGLTPVEILSYVNMSSEKYYLKQMLDPHKEVNYKQDLDKMIDMLGEPKFITCKKDPTKVS